jgi:hypothetical protein
MYQSAVRKAEFFHQAIRRPAFLCAFRPLRWTPKAGFAPQKGKLISRI